MSQQINLFNPLFLKQKKYFSARTMLQGLAIILVVLLAFQGVLIFQLRLLERQRTETQALHAQVQQQLVQSTGSGLRGPSKLVEDEIARVTGSIRRKPSGPVQLPGHTPVCAALRPQPRRDCRFETKNSAPPRRPRPPRSGGSRSAARASWYCQTSHR